MAGLAHYSPEDVTVLLGGVYPVDGFVDGSFISIQKVAPNFTTKVTADGQVCRTRVSSDVYSLGLTLASTASSNKILTTLAALDLAATDSKFPILIKDSNGSTTFFSPSAWISEIPSVEFDVEVSNREWRLTCAGGVLIVGGNEGGIIESVSAEMSGVGFLGLDAAGFIQ